MSTLSDTANYRQSAAEDVVSRRHLVGETLYSSARPPKMALSPYCYGGDAGFRRTSLTGPSPGHHEIARLQHRKARFEGRFMRRVDSALWHGSMTLDIVAPAASCDVLGGPYELRGLCTGLDDTLGRFDAL